LLDNALGVLLGELLKFLVARDGLLDFGNLILRDIAALVGAIFPGVEVVVRAAGALADDREGAVLHASDLEDLFQEVLRSERNAHEASIYVHIYSATKKGGKLSF
jgi:ATP-dependent protease HslVU (ClpYQ) peptidase subunit